MKKVIIKTKTFDLPIYGCEMVFVYSNTFKSVKDLLDAKNVDSNLNDDFDGYSFNITEEGREEYWLIIMKSKDKYDEIDTITHEVSHIVSNILVSRGIKFNKKDNNEPYAYLTGYLNKEFFKFKDGK